MIKVFAQKKLEQINLNIFLPFLFISIGLIGAFNHALWRDEMQGWLVANHSYSWIDLWKNNAPSGHPILWSALIYLVKGLTGTPLSMQILQWALASLAILIFWRWNPLPLLHKSLFTFGYFPFWEYFLVCRHYVLAELTTFLFCSTYSFRRKSYLPAAICIGLLTNTHAFAWAIAFAIGITLFAEWFLSPYQRLSYQENTLWKLDLLLSAIALFVLVGFAGFSLMQVKDSASINLLDFDLRHFLRVVGRIFGGFLLVVPNYRNWLDLSICTLIVGFMLSLTIKFLKRSRMAVIFFIVGIGSLFLFNYYIYLGVGSRHYGYYFLIFIAAIWLAIHPSENSENEISNLTSLRKNNENSFFSYLLIVSLSVHFAAGVHRTATDFFIPYSAGKATANYIRKTGLKDLDVFATRDVEVSTISGYLGKDFYYPELRSFGSYAKWNKRKPIDPKNVLDELEIFLSNRDEIDKLLLILSRGSALKEMNKTKEISISDFIIKPIKKFEYSWIDTERYYLYLVERTN